MAKETVGADSEQFRGARRILAEDLQRWDSEKDELVAVGVVPEDGFTVVASSGDMTGLQLPGYCRYYQTVTIGSGCFWHESFP